MVVLKLLTQVFECLVNIIYISYNEIMQLILIYLIPFVQISQNVWQGLVTPHWSIVLKNKYYYFFKSNVIFQLPRLQIGLR